MFRKKILKNTKAAVFLETALVMPVFLILLCFCIDIPRIIVLRQRAYGAQRMVAEVRARNSGTLNDNGAFIEALFFDDNVSSNISLITNSFNDKNTLISDVADIQNWIKNDIWKSFTGLLKFLGNIVTGGNLKPYFFNVFSKDKLYSGSVTVNAPTLLPPEAYNEFADLSAPTTVVRTKQECYMPSLDSCKYTGESFIAKLIDWLNKL